VGAQAVAEPLLRRLENDVEGVTRAVFDPSGQDGESADNDAGLIMVYAKRGRKALSPLIQIVNASGLEINSVEVREPDLEAVFLHLTGRALRE
jgi:ABC-2 type transport system ATP-binding protein